ncbi:MAG: transcriptional repressor NrdR [Clostridia bacterium]|nr:transcriptional repressor NrdR [Oscillospiraceae bacterium]MBQ8276045.1 transcriptional repressor NrdR [Clostridia bacterium]
MKCPSCGFPDSKVVDSRPIEDGSSIRRRRECASCGKRFTTFEVIDHIQVLVCKKDGTKELFDRSKLLSGLMKACQKRPVNAEQIASEIESELQNSLRPEVTTTEIGELAMRKLKSADAVAYVRFASVYREFKDVETFMEELRGLQTGSEQEEQA